MRFKLIYLVFFMVVIQFSCKKWIDVEPRTQIENDRFFVDAQSFEEALNGVYLKMTSTQLYGKELTFGLTDVLGGVYVLSSANGSLAYRNAFANNYTGDIRPVIDAIWTNSYNAIANLNNTVEQLDKRGSNFLTPTQFSVLKGEALGLRAFLHFDLLRLYGPSVAAGGLESQAIPYAREYKASASPRLKGSVVIEHILADLNEAETLLRSDVLFTSSVGSMERNLRFNYYAVKALQARVLLWKGDKVNALAAAESVIGVAPRKFPFILQAQLATGEQTRINRVFTTENIFGLQVNNLQTNYAGLLEATLSTTQLVITTAFRNQIYETTTIGTDYRNLYLIREREVGSPLFFYGKLYQPVGIPAEFAKRMPLIKIPEMYYIAAECLIGVDNAKAIGYLNTVRLSRGITGNLNASLSDVALQDEVRKEYRKEMPSEGQYFFYLKRTNATTRPNDFSGTPPAYILPLPDLETEFGI